MYNASPTATEIYASGSCGDVHCLTATVIYTPLRDAVIYIAVGDGRG